MQWHLFQTLWTAINGYIEPQIQAVYNSLLQYVTPTFRLTGLMYLTLICAGINLGQKRFAPDLVPALIRVLVGLLVLNATFYNQTIANLFLHSIPNGVLAAVASVGPNNGGITSGAGLFDRMIAEVGIFAATVMKQSASWWHPMQTILVAILLGAFLLIAGVAIAAGFAGWACSQLFLMLMIAVGPIPLACMLTTATRSWFERWLSALAGAIFLQVLMLAMLVIMVGALEPVLKNLSTMQITPGTDAITSVVVELGVVAGLFILLIYALKRTEHWAGQVMHGVAVRLPSHAQNAPGNITAGAASGAISGGPTGAVIGAASGALGFGGGGGRGGRAIPGVSYSHGG